MYHISKYLAVFTLLHGAISSYAEETPPPNILLVMVDTLRADHTSAYGYSRNTTPTLARLAAEGVRFQQVFSPTSTTGPSTVSLFTSLYPIHHRYLRNGLPLDSSFTTLAEVLHAVGYQTFGIASSTVLVARGMEQGFETFDKELPHNESSHLDANRQAAGDGDRPQKDYRYQGSDRRPNFTTDRALSWFDEQRDPTRPYFAWLHYMDPHEPYTPPDEYLALFPAPDESLPIAEFNLSTLIRKYDAEIRFMDTEFGRLLDHLNSIGALDNTLIAVVADHGQGLYQHGWQGHGLQLYDEAVRIPWIMTMPENIESGQVITAPVSLLDVMPTILSYTPVALPQDSVHGKNHRRAIDEGDSLDSQRSLFFQRRKLSSEPQVPSLVSKPSVEGGMFAVRAGDWKLITAPQDDGHELYNLAQDPLETVNVHEKRPNVVNELEKLLNTWRREFKRSTQRDNAEVLPELREGLEALGYVD